MAIANFKADGSLFTLIIFTLIINCFTCPQTQQNSFRSLETNIIIILFFYKSPVHTCINSFKSKASVQDFIVPVFS